MYNLHYFADLQATDFPTRSRWHNELIERWIRENPPVTGNGWESYPLSLRIVNWIKWSLIGYPLEDAWQHNLALQIRYLSKRLEWHLLGNHLLANAKAMVFAGYYFSGAEAERWRQTGHALLQNQLSEQILSDGGHFERSPMYHSLILEDLLDLLNLSRAYPTRHADPRQAVDDQLKRLQRMRKWLQTLTHPDGEIAFFNDAAIGVACPPAVLEDYAARLGLPALVPLTDGISALSASGYLRLQTGTAVALLDVAPVGPDYLPGHGHADTLSFELSLFGQRVLVNSGTSCYGSSRERLRQRSTAAHNSVVIDDTDSSEVWSGFRVARRARPVGLHYENTHGNGLNVRCGHDGYRRLRGRPLHWREWCLLPNRLQISDRIEGGFQSALACFHFHPALAVRIDADGTTGQAHFSDSHSHLHTLNWRIEQGRAELRPASYHPEFGVSQPAQCLVVHFRGAELNTCFEWC